MQPLPIKATGGEKASHHTPIGKYNFDHRMANAKPRISREAENLYDQCHQTRLQSPLEGGTWVWVSIDLGQGARYRHSTCSQAEVITSQVTSQGNSPESRMLLRPRLTIQMFRANLLSLNLFRLSPQSPPRRESPTSQNGIATVYKTSSPIVRGEM